MAQLPEGATYPDLDGAIKTAEFFLSQYAPMFQTGDTALWDFMSAPSCGYCTDASANATKVHEKGWTAEGGEITPDPTKTHAETTGEAKVLVTILATTADAVLRDGDLEKSREAGTVATYKIALALENDQWLVAGVVSESA